uniref:Resistin n=1 Tax=Ornithorhynchus anatinus TaxID=9258 RepID=A0A6I8NQG5_ORNAN
VPQPSSSSSLQPFSATSFPHAKVPAFFEETQVITLQQDEGCSPPFLPSPLLWALGLGEHSVDPGHGRDREDPRESQLPRQAGSPAETRRWGAAEELEGRLLSGGWLPGPLPYPVSSALKDLSLVCTSVFTQGALVACPSGYKATACSCGSACGSWDIRSDTVCHCQCRGIDWTSARCCQIRTA